MSSSALSSSRTLCRRITLRKTLSNVALEGRDVGELCERHATVFLVLILVVSLIDGIATSSAFADWHLESCSDIVHETYARDVTHKALRFDGVLPRKTGKVDLICVISNVRRVPQWCQWLFMQVERDSTERESFRAQLLIHCPHFVHSSAIARPSPSALPDQPSSFSGTLKDARMA